jgi:hypothetical protein
MKTSLFPSLPIMLTLCATALTAMPDYSDNMIHSQLVINKVYYIGSVTGDIDSMAPPTGIDFNKLNLGRLSLYGEAMTFSSRIDECVELYLDEMFFLKKNTYKICFFENSNILGIKTTGLLSKKIDKAKIALFHFASAFPRQQIIDFFKSESVQTNYIADRTDIDEFECFVTELKKSVSKSFKLTDTLIGNVQFDIDLIYEKIPKGEAIEKVRLLLSNVRDSNQNQFKFVYDKTSSVLEFIAFIDNEKYYMQYSLMFAFENGKLKSVSFSEFNIFK